jgi:hypothetical protein
MSKNREFFGSSKINTISYNEFTGLYDLILNDNSIVNTVRIYNTTNLIANSSNVGFFYISPDNKYIYLDGNSPILDIQYLNFSFMNSNVTNEQLLEIQLTVSASQKKIQNDTYDVLQLRLSNENPDIIQEIKKNVCLNFAYEQTVEKRKTQIELLKNNSIYNSYLEYSCINYPDMNILSTASILGFNNIKTSSSKVFEGATGNTTSGYINSPSNSSNLPSGSSVNSPNSTFLCNSNNTEINTFYVYGMTFMNGLLIIISIALILLVFDDTNKNKK